MDVPLLAEVDGFADLKLHVEVQIDSRMMTLREILEMEAGHVLKLARSAGENMDVLVGGSGVAHGEVVVIDDMVGIRITDFREEN
jgi:flagellar motor switch protein FliN/FliY